MRRLLSLAAVVAFPWWTTAAAQATTVGGWAEDYARLMQLAGPLPVTSVTARPALRTAHEQLTAGQTSHAWGQAMVRRTPTELRVGGATFALHPVEARMFANTSRPWGWNDGAVWQSRGLNFVARGGVDMRWGAVHLTLAPLVTHSTNYSFTLSPLAVPPGLSEYAYPTVPGATIDMPQRFGSRPVQRIDWGNTNLRAEWGPVALGLSHENLWWGPGRQNDILLTNHAPGFWHAHLSLVEPVSVGIGSITGRWIWGSLRESAFFDTIPANDRRYLTGAVVSFVPRWSPGLELGAARLFNARWTSTPGLDEILWLVRPVLKENQASEANPLGDDEQDQMATVFARWALPAAGLELYGEWARGDHSFDFRDLFVQPEHASAYLAGFQKVLSHSPLRTWRVGGEMTLLASSRTVALREPKAGAFYVHGLVAQGYTHRGQVLGAGIGPGSKQFSVAVDRFAPWGQAGVTLLRTVYDDNRFYARPEANALEHEVEPSVRFDATVFRGPWDLNASFTVSRLLNMWYQFRNDSQNLNIVVGARYHPSRAR
jgi:hypothetical protein